MLIPSRLVDILMFINFFFLALALLTVYYYAYKLRFELKRSDRLRKMAERYKDLFNSTTEGVFQCDEKGKFLIINRAGATLLGFENPDNLINADKKIYQFFLNPDAEEILARKLEKFGYAENFIIKARKRGGDEFALELTVNVRENEEGSGIEGLFRDVSNRVAMQEELRQYSEDLEEKVREKTEQVLVLERRKIELEKLASIGQISATIVHEIRNPLSSIKMGLTTLLKRSKLVEKDRRCLELASHEVTHLESILNDLLDFAKPQDLKLVRHDINQILIMNLDQIEDEFKSEGIVILRDLDPNIPRSLMDVKRINQVIRNILVNARQSITENGQVQVISKYLQNVNKIRIEIKDNGSGIEGEDLKQIFNPFFSTKDEGTGLGLPVVHKIIEAHGGSIGVDSITDKGTTVWYELPVDGSLKNLRTNR